MYEKNGEKYFVVDAHIALWDARAANQKNIHGKQFIDCFYDYHRNLSPQSELWSYEDYLYQGSERLINALVAAKKPFTMMAYPNRTHGIFEGEGTTMHLRNLLTTYLHEHLPSGASGSQGDRATNPIP